MSARFAKYRESLIFYFGVPVAIGFLLGWYNVYGSGDGSRIVGIFGWILHFEVYWIIGYTLLKTFDRSFSYFKVPKVFQFLLVAFVTSFCLRSLNWLIYALLVSSPEKSGVVPVAPARDITLFEPSFAFLSDMIVDYFPHSLLWLVTCWAISKFGGRFIFQFNGLHRAAAIEKVAPEVALDDNVGTKRSHFIRQLKPELGTDILLLKAEGHYVQTYTADGKELVYYRFGDAIDQLADKGIRVHRSFWISHRLLDSEDTKIMENEIVLQNYDSIPIGYSFKRQLLDYQKSS